MENTLYFGDNLPLLRQFIKDDSIDLIYLDPPFNSKENYNVFFKGTAQITAFEDTWHWHTGDTQREFTNLTAKGAEPKLKEVMDALMKILGTSDLLAYLTMMAIRLRELYRVLKDNGSLYLHCDPTASHYLKIILDAIFEAKNFRNEIIWKRSNAHGNAKGKFGALHDVILFYSKNQNIIFNKQFEYYSDEYIKKYFSSVEKETNRKFTKQNLTNYNKNRPNLNYDWKGHTRTWLFTKEKMNELDGLGKIIYSNTGFPRLKQYLDESKGVIVGDIWNDIKALKHGGKEVMGYPTQKPIALLERIIKTSTNEGDVILDPFCGCGTAIVAAQKLKRKWIGMDITHLAVGLMEQRIKEQFRITPKVIGNPASFSSAENLFKRSPLDFERWAVTRIDGIHPNKKQVGDGGVDGRGYIGQNGEHKVIVSVKGGKTLTPSMVAQLIGVMEKEHANFGILITIHKPTDGMLKEAISQGFVDVGLHHFPKIQIWTISDFFNGKKPNLP